MSKPQRYILIPEEPSGWSFTHFVMFVLALVILAVFIASNSGAPQP